MEIKPYTKDKFEQCLEVFMSNQDKYFADYELDEFKAYLQGPALKNPYFIVVENDEIIGCGGYEKEKNKVFLTWGMIKRELHRQGYGKALTSYRLNAIRAKYPNTTIIIHTSQHTKGFYQKAGFKVQKLEKDGFGKGLDNYTMTV